MIRIYNTLIKSVEEFRPMNEGRVNMFVCGPTVYDYIHAGNARTFVIFDVVAKYLRWRGYKLNYIQNITDIDDKIIEKAKGTGEDPLVLAKKFHQEFESDMRSLNITSPNQYIPATDRINAIIEQVKTLKEKGFAYEISDGIYFDLSKFPEYGKLSGRKAPTDDDAISRIDENTEKRNSGDFCLWKYSKPGEPSWDFATSKYIGISDGSPAFASPSHKVSDEQSKASAGRPGWHIEDTAITESVFGPQYDLHGGGRDLVFPHHEAEITQQESASGLKPFVRYWMHVNFLENKTAKMSKSAGNFRTVRDLLGEYSPEVLRFYFLSAHYRSPLDFSLKILDQAEAGIQRIIEFMDRLRLAEEHAPFSNTCDPQIITAVRNIQSHIHATMDEDFNTPQAIAKLFDLIRLGNQYLDEDRLGLECAGHLLEILDFFHAVLGIIPLNRPVLPDDISQLVKQRQLAREAEDFKKSDELRDKLLSLGWKIDDTIYGPLVKPLKNRSLQTQN